MSDFCHVMVGERFNPEWDSEIPKGPITVECYGTRSFVTGEDLSSAVGGKAQDIGANLVCNLSLTLVPTQDRYASHSVILTGDAYYVPNLEEWFAEQAEIERSFKQNDQL